MISTKRQIRRDDDRYGSFDADNASPLLSDFGISGDVDYIGNSMLRSDVDIDITNTAASTDIPEYTTEAAAPANVEVPPPAPLPERPAKPEVPHSREDVLPTLKTRSYATERTETEPASVATERTKESVRPARRGITSRERIMLCVYVAIALVLAIAVIATGVSISTASVQSDALVGQIEQKQAVILAQESELAVLQNEDNIRGRATEFGMVQAGESVYDAPVAETVDYPQANPHTNPFDEFMDWLSGLLN